MSYFVLYKDGHAMPTGFKAQDRVGKREVALEAALASLGYELAEYETEEEAVAAGVVGKMVDADAGR